ncbi:PH domain-containing protein [Desulfosporosinus sp. BG]|uniref:PH domain-containing protein n=1 Tax=Desulfosporosinus sp. BG TaxID=1633135 RepID=UPI00083B2050|nr:PH domain-containing protein [Desulfosporosinus sp. BG]ODA38768.1 hypothetical protein DSBG_4453 [Desulfosporosinus sp. BG]
MRYFKRKAIMSILFLFCGVMILFSGLLQLTMKNNNAAIFQILVALMFAYDAYVYITPYLGLDEEKLIVNNGLLKKEVILLKDITAIDDKNKKLIISFTQGSSTKQLKILLSHLKIQDREQFMKDLKSRRLGDKVCEG